MVFNAAKYGLTFRIIHFNPDTVTKGHKRCDELSSLYFFKHANFSDATIADTTVFDFFTLTAFKLIGDRPRTNYGPGTEITSFSGMSDKFGHIKRHVCFDIGLPKSVAVIVHQKRKVDCIALPFIAKLIRARSQNLRSDCRQTKRNPHRWFYGCRKIRKFFKDTKSVHSKNGCDSY